MSSLSSLSSKRRRLCADNNEVLEQDYGSPSNLEDGSISNSEEASHDESCPSTPSRSDGRSPGGSFTPISSSVDGDLDTTHSLPSAASAETAVMVLARPDTICYGMLIKVPIETNIGTKLPGFHSKKPASLQGRCVYLKHTESLHIGHLERRTALIVRALDEMDSIILQFEVSRCPQENLHPPGKRKRSKKLVTELSIIMYGPIEYADDVGMFLVKCGLYLQDPHKCELEVLYHNPQSYWAKDGGESRRIKYDPPVSEQESFEARPDLLQQFEYNGELAHAQQPSALKTELHDHQRQALYFMLNREVGWNFQGPLNDLWITKVSVHDVKYINTVTEEEQATPPPNFSGGILADQMGLGKSLSIIALIANDQDDGKLLIGHNDDEALKTTLIVVRAPLIHVWEAQLHQHVHHTRLRWRRHHDKVRLKSHSDLHEIDIVLTTYQTLVSEFRKHGKSEKGSPQLAYQVKWRRVVLDEAHDIRDYNRATAKAMRRLNAVSRWAVTGTPIQNSVADIASLYQFLRIEPYTDEPTLVKQHIKQLFEEMNPEAESRTRRLIRCIMLRRSLQVVALPEREELIYRLDFSTEEAKVYDEAKLRTGALLDGGDVSTFHILPWINSLRMICNLGTHTELPKHHIPPTDSIWTTSVAQEMFNTLMNTGAAICSSCSTVIAAVPTEVADDVPDLSTELQLSSCSYLICGPCIERQGGTKSRCTHSPQHEMQRVSRLSLSLSRDDDHLFTTATIPTKVKALILDLDQHIKNEKCVVFSFWTSTLDVIEQYIDHRFQYIRFDGKVPNEQRRDLLNSFRDDADIRVALLSISCGAVGLDLTSASRAYLMEPHWNPSIEHQALARIYRMGQTRKVTTIRYIMRDSFEDNVLDIQNRKQALTEMLMPSDNQGNSKTPIKQLNQFRAMIMGKSKTTALPEAERDVAKEAIAEGDNKSEQDAKAN